MNTEGIKNKARRVKSYFARNGLKATVFRSAEEVVDKLRDIRYSMEAGQGAYEYENSGEEDYEEEIAAESPVDTESEGAAGINSEGYSVEEETYTEEAVNAEEDTYAEETAFTEEPEASAEAADRQIFISILIPVYDPDPAAFADLIYSLDKQTYTHFEAVIADGSTGDGVEAMIHAYTRDENRPYQIRYKRLPENKGISGNTNAAINMATGEYSAFLDHDDFLSPDALSEVAAALQTGADIVYTDEDKYDGKRFFKANRKPDFNLDLLLSNNYICHFLVVKTELLIEAGGLRSEFDGAQDHDLMLRLIEKVDIDKIAHVPKVLYHWRVSGDSTAENPDSKSYAYDSGKKAIGDYFSRRGIEVNILDTAHRGFFYTEYQGEIPLEAYKLLLSKRLVPMSPDYEKRLSSYFNRAEVGAVGGRVIGTLGRILCNGYTTDSLGRRVSLFKGINTNFSGDMHRAAVPQDVEAVSGKACVVRKELMQYYDKDPMVFFERIREKGFLVIIDPNVVFKLAD